MRVSNRDNIITASLPRAGGGRDTITARNIPMSQAERRFRAPVGKGRPSPSIGRRVGVTRETPDAPNIMDVAKGIMGELRVDTGGFSGKAAKARAHTQRSKYQKRLADVATALTQTDMRQRGETTRADMRQQGEIATTGMQQRGATTRKAADITADTARFNKQLGVQAEEREYGRKRDVTREQIRSLESNRDFEQRERSLGERIRKADAERKDEFIAGAIESGTSGSITEANRQWEEQQLINKMTPEQRAQYLAESEEPTPEPKKKSWYQ